MQHNAHTKLCKKCCNLRISGLPAQLHMSQISNSRFRVNMCNKKDAMHKHAHRLHTLPTKRVKPGVLSTARAGRTRGFEVLEVGTSEKQHTLVSNCQYLTKIETIKSDIVYKGHTLHSITRAISARFAYMANPTTTIVCVIICDKSLT